MRRLSRVSRAKMSGFATIKKHPVTSGERSQHRENEGLIMCICKRVKTSFKEKEI